MTTYYPLTAATFLANLRQDLSDTGAVRWPDAQLNRCIDRALERYSWVAPFLQSLQQQSAAGLILYGSPAGCYYVDRVEFPINNWPKTYQTFLERKSPLIPAPQWTAPPLTAPTLTAVTGSGSLGAGQYTYAFTYTVPGGGETSLSSSLVVTPGANNRVTINNIPIGPYGVSGRKLYRTVSGGSQLLLLATLADNTTTIYTDGAADGSLGAAAPTVNTTANIDQVELQLPTELWPADNTKTLEITYASKHLLDSTGTTVPERHWDALYIGAVAFAMFAYRPQVNDNFEYADGHLRDRVDDTKSIVAWSVQCGEAMHDFETFLKQIKEEANTSILSTITHWGDKPLRWERL